MTFIPTPLDPDGLNIFSNERDILRDLFVYLDYVSEHNIKRMMRSNELPQADFNRIAKLMGIPGSTMPGDGTPWIKFIENLACNLHLVSYNRKGEYRGYTSSAPTFPDNFILFNAATCQKFFELPPAAQEKQILESLIKFQSIENSALNELEHASVLTYLDKMRVYNSHIDQVDFPQVRQFLLKLLKNCEPGVWYSCAALVAYLKAEHPYFLLPKNLPEKDRWDRKTSRYYGFWEGEGYYQNQESIDENAPDAFERVEGRYVERFLERVPLLMRFVDVAYDPTPYTGKPPSLGLLKAFRVRDRFLRLMQNETAEPKVTVQPNFDVVVESDLYPASIIRQVAELGELMSNPNSGQGAYVGIFQLNKTAVARAHVNQPGLDVVALLTNLSGRDLPANVRIELEEWAGHADQFTIYEGFSILESVETLPDLDDFTVEHITPNLCLVEEPEILFSTLETLGQVPLLIQHPDGKFMPVAESATSVFPKETPQMNVPPKARPVKVSCVVTLAYRFPDEDSFDVIRKTLAELRCPFLADPKTHVISLQQKEQAKFEEALQQVQDLYAIEIE